jgi:pimeloyl-ACP methyl ester carboxylesterase
VARVLRQSLGDRLERTVTVPVTVVVGGRDPLSSSLWQKSLGRPMRAPTMMAGLPHSAPHSAPVAFARLVLALDEELRGGSGAAMSDVAECPQSPGGAAQQPRVGPV